MVPHGHEAPPHPHDDAAAATDGEGSPGVATRVALERTVAALTGAEEHPVRIGPYRIVERLGAGGMGLVFAARDERLERDVAIKLLRRDLSDHGGLPDLALDEARIAARLDHPNVVTIHEVGAFEGQPYFVMERIVGEDLRSYARTHAPEAVLDAYLQAARGLEAAHEAGIVHGDFKPENVLVDDRGRARVIDFGVAALQVAMADAPCAGTPGYVAPEVAAGAPPTPAADLYALAVSIYEGLTGRRPAGADDMEGPLPRRIPRGVLATLRRAAHADPAARHGAVGAFVAEIDRAFARRRTLRATALAGGALVAMFGLSRVASPPAGAAGTDATVPTDAGAPAEPSMVEVAGVHAARLSNGFSVFVVPRRDAATLEARLVVRAGYPAEGDLPGLAHLALVAVEAGTERLGTLDPERDLRLREREAALFAELARPGAPSARARVFAALARLREEAAGSWVSAPGDAVLARWGARRYGVLQGWDVRTVAEIPRGRLVPYLALEAERLRAPVLRDFWGIVARTAAEAAGAARAVAPGERLADRLLTEHLGFVVDPVAELNTVAAFPYAETARFLRERFVPGQAALILVGDLDPTMTLAAVRRAFEGLAPAPDARPYP
ncbi:MAG: serine/threonine protein kinase, partial [Deltaproteobacteria bacterium]